MRRMRGFIGPREKLQGLRSRLQAVDGSWVCLMCDQDQGVGQEHTAVDGVPMRRMRGQLWTHYRLS